MSEQLLSLVVFAAVMTFSPGSNNVLMATSGIQVGLRRSIPLGLGVVSGVAVLLTVAAVGLGGIIHTMPSLQVVMKTIGSAYLVWLGWKIAHAGPPTYATTSARTYGFRAGFINTMLNPKGWTMALSAAAGYSALASDSVRLSVLFSIVFVSLGIPNWFVWCRSGETLARLLRTEQQWQIANAALGGLVMLSLVPMWLE